MRRHALHFSHANADPTSFGRQRGGLSDILLYANACKSQRTTISTVGMFYHALICEAHELMQH